MLAMELLVTRLPTLILDISETSAATSTVSEAFAVTADDIVDVVVDDVASDTPTALFRFDFDAGADPFFKAATGGGDMDKPCEFEDLIEPIESMLL
jgi:hypothetical protein